MNSEQYTYNKTCLKLNVSASEDASGHVFAWDSEQGFHTTVSTKMIHCQNGGNSY
jgi:hypothetical protein